MMKRSNAKISVFRDIETASLKIREEKNYLHLFSIQPIHSWLGPLKRTMTDDPQKRVNSWHVRVFISLSICPPGKETNILYGTVFFFPKRGETTIGCNRPISNSICTLGQVRVWLFRLATHFDYFYVQVSSSSRMRMRRKRILLYNF